MSWNKTILLTGSSGYVGKLTAIALLAKRPDVRLLLPVRSHHDADELVGELLHRAAELNPAADLRPGRIIIDPFPHIDEFLPPASRLRDLGVKEIVHSLGSLSYDDVDELSRINVELTGQLVRLAAEAQVERFFYVSTAFSSGLGRDQVGETLHPEPDFDATPYTKSKRQAEQIVASSGLPYVILRPSVVVGHSQNGIYSGRPSGLYLLLALAKSLLRKYHDSGTGGGDETIHMIATDSKLHVIHEDHLQDAIERAIRLASPGEIIHLVSGEDSLATVREILNHWASRYTSGHQVRFHKSLADFPQDDESVGSLQRTFIEAAATHLEISSHALHFGRENLAKLYGPGEKMPASSLESLGRSIDWFMTAEAD